MIASSGFVMPPARLAAALFPRTQTLANPSPRHARTNAGRLAAAGATAVLLLAQAAPAQTTYVETFDDGANHTGWTWDRTAAGGVEPSGGNPGGFFQSDLRAVPALFSVNDLFTGDFRQRRVGSIGGDLRTVEYAAPSGVISLALAHHNGTPDNPFDDTIAHFVTSIAAPVTPDMGWVSFDVTIPFDATTTPAGWALTGVIPLMPPTVSWDELITNVDEIAIAWNSTLDPVLLFDVVRGADNLRVTYNVPSPAAPALLALSAACLAGRRRRGNRTAR